MQQFFFIGVPCIRHIRGALTVQHQQAGKPVVHRRRIDGLAQVEKNGKYGYINSKGKEVIKVQYKQADRFSEGLALIQEGKKYKYIDKTGSTVINVRENIRPSFRKDMQACR